MTNQLASHIQSMIDNYSDNGGFTKSDVNKLLHLSDSINDVQTLKLINKFMYMFGNIAKHAGAPILKQILTNSHKRV